jgi:hypothetical protein
MTECNQSQFEFEAHFSRRVVAEFSGERLTTEGGALLLRAADRKIGLLRRVVHCYLPLYVFCGDHLLCARLRPSNQDASAGSLEEVRRIVRQIRARWPNSSIILRADSGFGREELMVWCEKHAVNYVFGFARNKRLRRIIGRAMQQAKQEHRRTGKPARVFCEFAYRTKKSWSRARRVVAKAEQIEGKENPRYLVTSLGKEAWPAQQLYEQLY